LYDVLLVKYGEIGLKGRNRRDFEERLAANLRRAAEGFEGVKVEREYGRIAVRPADDSQLAARLCSVFGVVAVSPAVEAGLAFEAIVEACQKLVARRLEEAGKPLTFKVEARRPNKAFPLTSPQINAQVGAALLRAFPELRVDVHKPAFQLTVEVRQEQVYVYDRSLPGPGGLPVGASSRGLLLLSGGIDSPVAGWLAMKRGVAVEAIHFHSFPFTSERSKEKVIELARVLSGWSPEPVPVHVVPFTEAQTAIKREVPAPMRITVMRRMMLRIAERIARARRIPALVTGESVGQVASQTLESMAAINAVTSMPVLRPLVAMDKAEIVELATRIGTYEISVLPYDDCCTLFVPDNPETKPRIERVERAESRLDIAALVEGAVSGIELVVAEPRPRLGEPFVEGRL